MRLLVPRRPCGPEASAWCPPCRLAPGGGLPDGYAGIHGLRVVEVVGGACVVVVVDVLVVV